MRKIRQRATAILAIAILTAVAFGSPASAAICEFREVCLWKDANWQGHTIEYRGNDRDYSNNNWPGCRFWQCGVNDSISSIRNRGAQMDTIHYVHAGHWGDRFRLARGKWLNVGAKFNDELSSHRWV